MQLAELQSQLRLLTAKSTELKLSHEETTSRLNKAHQCVATLSLLGIWASL